MEKEKLSYEEMIDKFKEKGVKFNIINEDEAKKYLKDSCYYFKLNSYKKNYEKNNDGKYINLEFAYLVELSKIDKYIRYEVLNLCLDIEHALKLLFINEVCDNSNGYEPVKEFFEENPLELESLNSHKNSSYTKSLIEKYNDEFPVWALFEVISFGGLIKFIDFYQKKFDKKLVDGRILNNVRDLRNAAAHNNCLIRNLISTKIRPLYALNQYLSVYYPDISANVRSEKLKNKFLHDFVALLYMHNIYVNDKEKIEGIKNLFENRVLDHKDYFVGNLHIVSAYQFIIKLLKNA